MHSSSPPTSSLRRHFLAHVAQTSEFPLALEIAKAQGVWLYDTTGKRYLDLIAGISVSNLGHGHPKVLQAIHEQTDRYLHTLVYGEYILSPQVAVAQHLADLLPGGDWATYFVNSGAEATEGAMKLAKRHTGRREIIAMRKSYHGSTQGALSLMSEPTWTEPFAPLLPDIKHLSFNCSWCLREVTPSTAAVIVEVVKGEEGVIAPQAGYLAELQRRCHEVGALLIFDEIQTGCGRTGAFFAFEHWGVVPDILLLGKAFGGGLPLGAFIARRALMHDLAQAPPLGHITTFGGNPLCCAAALAALQYLRETPTLLSSVRAKELLFRQLLVHPAIVEVRSVGLLMAVELANFDAVIKVIRYAVSQGVITDWFLFNDRSLRIAPPLIISEEEIRFACRVLLAGMDGLK